MEIKHYKASELLLLRRNVMRPNMESFEDVIYDFEVLKQRLREMAFLTKGLKIILNDEREFDEEGNKKVKTREFHYEGGIKEFECLSPPEG